MACYGRYSFVQKQLGQIKGCLPVQTVSGGTVDVTGHQIDICLRVPDEACGNTETSSNESNEKKENIVKAPERDLAEGDYQDIGNGSLDLINESGSTAEGEDIVVYPDMDWEPYANVDYV